MEALITSTLLVALAEIGDKTQLLSFVLAARLKKPGAIIAGSTSEERQLLRRYGEKIGLAFQLADDLLDLTADTETMGKATGKDKERGKGTLVALHGMDWAEETLSRLVAEAGALVAPYGEKAKVLIEAASFVARRTH